MKLNICSLCSRTLATFALLVGISLVGTAFAQGYKVPEKRTTDIGEHENAIYVEFESKPPPGQQIGIMFMQTQGTYPYQAWTCMDSVWSPSTQSRKCFKDSVLNGIDFRETVTIGRLPNGFCDLMRTRHNLDPNNPDPDHPIMQPSECPGGAGNCSCYEVRHECRANPGDPYTEAACPADFPSPTAAGEPDKGEAPPGSGAGSGSNN